MNAFWRRIMLSKPIERFCELHLQLRADAQREQGWPSRFDSVSPDELDALDRVFDELKLYRERKVAELAARKGPTEFPEVISAMVPLQHDASSHQ